ADLQLRAGGGAGADDLAVPPRPHRAGLGAGLRVGHRPARPRRRPVRGRGARMTARLTPSQTAGPYLAIGLPWPDGPFVVAEGAPGAITITGVIWDGAGAPVPDALGETWQADPDGRFAPPGGPAGRRRAARRSLPRVAR